MAATALPAVEGVTARRYGDGVLYRSCPWCGRPWRNNGCQCLSADAERPQVRIVPGVDRTVCLHRYRPVVQRFVLAAKNGGRRDLLTAFGYQLAENVPLELGPATVTWIPASRSGRRRRGYDQSRLLARALGRRIDYPVAPLLRRSGNETQAGLGRSERLNGPNIACRLTNVPTRIILVDDVVTTGASLRLAAAELRRAGAETVIALCVASAQSEYGTKVASPAGAVRSMVIP